ncbi:MAG: hypothetical protein CMJ49_06775 [Planctomycetaceae bacterium]|nr:hypothetical protein [Planctomycetaceae bacterium]
MTMSLAVAPVSAQNIPSVNAVGYPRQALIQGQGSLAFPADNFFDVFVDTFDDLNRLVVNVDTERNTVSAAMTAMYQAGGSGGAAPVPVTLTGLMVMDVLGKGTDTTGSWDTEILSMSLTGDIPGMQIREHPGMDSTGRVSVTDIGGGLYHIDSFFDVFTELSLDGGQSWTPAQSSVRMVLVPAPAALPVGLALRGVIGTRRHRRAT